MQHVYQLTICHPTPESASQTLLSSDAAKGQAGAPEIAGVVVTLIAMVTLGIVGAVTVAVFIVHKRSKKNTGGHIVQQTVTK